MSVLKIPPRKFPRIPHLPNSPGMTIDDIALTHTFVDISFSPATRVVVTEKLDGEIWTFTRSYCHPRSHNGATYHPSHSYVKKIWGAIRYSIWPDVKIVGEFLGATHQIQYPRAALPSLFMVFAAMDIRGREMFSWGDTRYFADHLSIPLVPILHEGAFLSLDHITTFYTGESVYGVAQEGFVVRVTPAISINDDNEIMGGMAKYVRKNHVPAKTPHWSKAR